MKTIKSEHSTSTLSDNHRRSLTSALVIVEQMLSEVRRLMTETSHQCCSEVQIDIDAIYIEQNLKTIEDALQKICQIKEKYGAEKRSQSLKRTINAKMTKIWEVLSDSKSRKMKGFGIFPQGTAKEYDRDIDELMAIASNIKS